MRSRIFEEIRYLNIRCNHVWQFNTYQARMVTNLSKEEAKCFYAVMDELCKEGLFVIINAGKDANHYRLTAKGENEIYSVCNV